MSVTLNAFYCTCYYFEFPFMERYKVYELEWPWKVNKDEFIAILHRTWKLTFLNVFIINAVGYTPHYFFDIPVPLDFSIEGIPDSTKMIG